MRERHDHADAGVARMLPIRMAVEATMSRRAWSGADPRSA